MKRTVLFILVVIIAALSVMSVSAAPHGRYFDQIGNKHWCTSDSYGCWVTGEDGGKNYIMFWSEAAAEAIMGKNSGAPIGAPLSGNLNLAGPKAPVAAVEAEKDDGGDDKQKECKPACNEGYSCVDGSCQKNEDPAPKECTGCTENQECDTSTGQCKVKSDDED